jgi:hypothetical protein
MYTKRYTFVIQYCYFGIVAPTLCNDILRKGYIIYIYILRNVKLRTLHKICLNRFVLRCVL